MAFSNGSSSSPISEQDIKNFTAFATAPKRFGNSCFISQKDMHWEFPILAPQHNLDANDPYRFKVLPLAAADASSPNSLITRTQLPILDSSNKVPGNTIIGIYGMRCYLPLGASIAALPADLTSLHQVIDAFERSMVVFETASNVFYEIAGDRLFNYGVGLQSTALGASGAGGYDGSPVVSPRGVRLHPIMLGKEEQLNLSLYINRLTDWPAALVALMRPRFILDTLIATAT